MTNANSVREIKRGLGSDDRPLCKDLLARDSVQSSPMVQETGNVEPDNIHVDFARYYDRDHARSEVEKLWLKTWLLAGREEDIPEIGDRMPFDIGPLSFMIIRTGPGAFKAFYNSCLHRGMQLCDAPASGDTIRCPFHGWEWDIDGTLKKISNWWDFPDVTRANGALRAVTLGLWGGFIFINADPDCAPLEEALGPIPRHFEGYEMEGRYTAARFRKLVPANWKLVQEAFQEAYHVATTHPEAVSFSGDTQTQYDIWDSAHSHIARGITPSGIPSMNAGPDANAIQAAHIYAHFMKEWRYPEGELPSLDPARDLRKQLADWHRAMQLKYSNRTLDVSDTVMLDMTPYYLFPNAVIWLSETLPYSYVFLPHPSDPTLSYFELRLLHLSRAGEPRAPAAAITEIGLDEKFSESAFGTIAGMVFDQDLNNMSRMQRGVQAADPTRHHTHLGRYQEGIVQHWNKLFDQYMAR